MPAQLMTRLACLVAFAMATGCAIPISADGEDFLPSRTQVVVVTDNSAPSWVAFERPTFQEKQGVENPIIDSFTPAINDVTPGQPVAFTVVANHPKQLPLQYNWSSTGGVLSGTSGRVVNWTPPNKAGTYTITVIVSDNQGGVVTGNLNMSLKQDLPGNPEAPSPTPTPVVSATPTPSPSATPTPVASPTPTPQPSVAPSQDPSLARVQGSVRSASGLALAGAQLNLVKAADETSAFTARSTQSAADGSFAFANVPAGLKLQVVAQASGHREGSLSLSTEAGRTALADFSASAALQAF